MADLYILHFDKPVWGKARHYVGYTTIGVEERIKVHRLGCGAKFVAYALKNGNDFKVSYTEHFDTRKEARRRELKLKRERNLSSHCLICRGETKNERIIRK